MLQKLTINIINFFKKKNGITKETKFTDMETINGSKIVMKDILMDSFSFRIRHIFLTENCNVYELDYSPEMIQDLRANCEIDINEADYFKPENMTKRSLYYLIDKFEGKDISKMAQALNRDIKINEILDEG